MHALIREPGRAHPAQYRSPGHGSRRAFLCVADRRPLRVAHDSEAGLTTGDGQEHHLGSGEWAVVQLGAEGSYEVGSVLDVQPQWDCRGVTVPNFRG